MDSFLQPGGGQVAGITVDSNITYLMSYVICLIFRVNPHATGAAPRNMKNGGLRTHPTILDSCLPVCPKTRTLR